VLKADTWATDIPFSRKNACGFPLGRPQAFWGVAKGPFIPHFPNIHSNKLSLPTIPSQKHIMQEAPHLDPAILLELVKAKMPFGKYAGQPLHRLPVSYLEWFSRKGFPQGKLGQQLELMLVIKSNGLEELLRPLIASA
jgi:uncharacterized protein (DUF3820 family)